ncbi:MAG: hypothetical protein JNL12_09460 [Planctomycetes bacterium]|nr:hypothetical protein [Planctomycetota bacterium]
MRPTLVPTLLVASLLSLWRDAAAQLRSDLVRLPPDTVAPTILGLEATGEHRTLRAPGDGRPCGLAWCGDTLWLLRDRALLRVDPTSGAELESLPAEGWVSLAADGRFLLAATGVGDIVVIDPIAGRPVRTIEAAPELIAPIRGIAVLGQHTLLADSEGRVLRLNAGRTSASAFWRHPGWEDPSWITADGKNLVFARGGLIHWVDPSDGMVIRTAGAAKPLLAAAPRNGELWLLQPAAQGDVFFVLSPFREVDCIAVSLVGVGGPGVGAPGAKPGDTTHWLVGRHRADTAAELGDLLRDAHRVGRRSDTVDGGRAPTPFVLHVHPGVTVSDILRTLDAAAAAGIELRTPGLGRWAASR